MAHQASRAEHQGEPGNDLGYNSGYAHLEHDVVTLPPDQQALGLVEAILEEAREPLAASMAGMQYRTGIIRDTAERLKGLVEKQPAMLEALKAARDVIHLQFCQAGDKGGNKKCWKECRNAQAAIDAASWAAITPGPRGPGSPDTHHTADHGRP